MEKFFGTTAALLAGFSVMMGAFGAHAGARLMDEKQREWLDKAVRYNITHALAILITVGLLPGIVTASPLGLASAVLFLAGILLFSGSLYIMAFTKARLGWITPLGGLCFVIGWLLLALSF